MPFAPFKVFRNSGAVGFQKDRLKKMCCIKIILQGGTLLQKVTSAVKLSEKQSFWNGSHLTVKCLVLLIYSSPRRLYCLCGYFH